MEISSWIATASRPVLAACAVAALTGCGSSFTDLDDFATLGKVEYDRPDGVTAEGGSRVVSVTGTFATGVCNGLSARLRTEGRSLTVRVISTHPGRPCPDEVIRTAYALRVEDLSPGEYRVVVVHSRGIGGEGPVFDAPVSVDP